MSQAQLKSSNFIKCNTIHAKNAGVLLSTRSSCYPNLCPYSWCTPYFYQSWSTIGRPLSDRVTTHHEPLYFHWDVNENGDDYLSKNVCRNRVPVILPSYFQEGHLTFKKKESIVLHMQKCSSWHNDWYSTHISLGRLWHCSRLTGSVSSSPMQNCVVVYFVHVTCRGSGSSTVQLL